MEHLEDLQARLLYHMNLSPSEVRKMPYSYRERLIERLGALSKGKERL